MNRFSVIFSAPPTRQSGCVGLNGNPESIAPGSWLHARALELFNVAMNALAVE